MALALADNPASQALGRYKCLASVLREHSRICSRHFLHGDPNQLPSLEIGERFASPWKRNTACSHVARSSLSPSFQLPPKRPARSKKSEAPPSPAPTTQSQHSPSSSFQSSTPMPEDIDNEPLSAAIGEPLLSDYSVHVLPGEHVSADEIIVNTSLMSRIEILEAENERLKEALKCNKPKFFRLEDIANDDSLVQFYTGFPSHEVFLAVFEFLGPSVNSLHYWGTSARRTGKRGWKLDPKNQFFLTLIRLRLNVRVRNLAYRFGISIGLVSRYIITWICFLYQHLGKIEWMPKPEQEAANLPYIFAEKYPTTFSIIDASEIFIETPSDLYIQSSTWSDYKHHNTAKCLVACTPNGVISFVSPLYMGGISDVELTRVSGFIERLPKNTNPKISVMADRGFTVQDQLNSVGVDLNIPPFLSGRKQLLRKEVEQTRKIASVHIHVEPPIGRIKNFAILKGT